MSYLNPGLPAATEISCMYGGSKLQFRGPQRALEGSYIACFGGVETFGRFVDRPYSSLLEQRLDRKCINFGSLSCGLEALSQDRIVPDLMNGSSICVLQVLGATGVSNRFYRVHPRRNDRFLQPTQDMIALYPEVDFTDFHFVRHLLSHLLQYADARFEVIAQELRQIWIRRMRSLLERINRPVILLWLRYEGELAIAQGGLLGCEPALVGADMIAKVQDRCARVIETPVRVSGESEELEDMLFGTLQQPLAEHMLGPAMHQRIAEGLYRAVLEVE